MKIASPSVNDGIQIYSSVPYTSTLFKQSSGVPKNFGLGLGFNSPKNEAHRMITLSTRVTTDINRPQTRFEKTNGVYELKNSKLTLESSSKGGSVALTSSAVQLETPKNDKASHLRNNSQGAFSHKKKSSDSTTASNGSKHQSSYKRSSSQVFQGGAKIEQTNINPRELKINTEVDAGIDVIIPSTKVQSTKNQYSSELSSTGSARISKPTRRILDGPVRLLTSSNQSDWTLDGLSIGKKMQTAPNDDRIETSPGISKNSKQEIYRKATGNADFYSTYVSNRGQSRERSNDLQKEKASPSGDRRIGFTNNGQLQYSNRGQGVIKSNTFFTNTGNSWFSSVNATREKPTTQSPKYDYKTPNTKEGTTRPASTEKRLLTKQDSQQKPSKSISGKYEAQTHRVNTFEADEESKQEKENKTPSKEASLQSFVTKVNKGDILKVAKKISVDEFKPLTQHSTSKLASTDKSSSQGLGRNNESKNPNSAVSMSNRGPAQAKEQTKEPAKEVRIVKLIKTDRTETETQKSFIYYMTNLKKYHREYNESDYFCQIYREHFIQSFQAMVFCKYLKPIDQKVLASKKMILPKRETHKDKKTLIFDLDETLIHCNESTDIPSDVILPIKFPHGEIIQAGINIRPYAREILKELNQFYEIIVFTASHSCYANVILDYLDPEKRYIHHRLFREHCMPTEEGVYVKDLRVLGNRSMQNMIIVDNAAYSFGYQINNGIPVIPYYDNKNDQELKHLIPYLKFLSTTRDPREINKITFKMFAYSQYSSSENVLESLIFQE